MKQGSVGFTASSHPQQHRARARDCPSLRIPVNQDGAPGSAKPWVAAVGGEDSPAVSASILLPHMHTLPPSLAPRVPVPSHTDQCPPVPGVPTAQ